MLLTRIIICSFHWNASFYEIICSSMKITFIGATIYLFTLLRAVISFVLTGEKHTSVGLILL